MKIIFLVLLVIEFSEIIEFWVLLLLRHRIGQTLGKQYFSEWFLNLRSYPVRMSMNRGTFLHHYQTRTADWQNWHNLFSMKYCT